MKKLINDPSTCVSDALEGLLLIRPDLKRVENHNVVVRRDVQVYRESFVTLISGGGSGHEPAHAGFIGEGCLTGAVLGNVFASPSVSTILAAIRTCGGPHGILLIVKNYTGDRLNFGMAMERAKGFGIKCKMVVVEDDCALPEGKGITGGRGVAGTIFVHKIAGAYASQGYSLDDVYEKALQVSKCIGSMGIALSTCTLPGAPPSTRLAAEGLIEIGMGIHGEPGRQQTTLPTQDAAKIIASSIIDGIIGGDGIKSRLTTNPGQKVAILINNLGGLPVIEQLIMSKEFIRQLKSRSLLPIRAYVGSFMTSLDMNGLSLSILKLDENSSSKSDILALLDYPATGSWVPSLDISDLDPTPISYDSMGIFVRQSKVRPPSRFSIGIVHAIVTRIIEIEPILTKYDSICGDGDCGLVMKAGANQIFNDLFLSENAVKIREKILCDSAYLCDQLAESISRAMGGSSGALLELFFRAAATSLIESSERPSEDEMDWIPALDAGLQAMTFYGGATEGMRTMLDALIPAVKCLKSGGSVAAAADAAQQGMEKTKYMESLAGRSNYVSKTNMDGTPDPGAVVVAEAFAVAAMVIAMGGNYAIK